MRGWRSLVGSPRRGTPALSECHALAVTVAGTVFVTTGMLTACTTSHEDAQAPSTNTSFVLEDGTAAPLLSLHVYGRLDGGPHRRPYLDIRGTIGVVNKCVGIHLDDGRDALFIKNNDLITYSSDHTSIGFGDFTIHAGERLEGVHGWIAEPDEVADTPDRLSEEYHACQDGATPVVVTSYIDSVGSWPE